MSPVIKEIVLNSFFFFFVLHHLFSSLNIYEPFQQSELYAIKPNQNCKIKQIFKRYIIWSET